MSWVLALTFLTLIAVFVTHEYLISKGLQESREARAEGKALRSALKIVSGDLLANVTNRAGDDAALVHPDDVRRVLMNISNELADSPRHPRPYVRKDTVPLQSGEFVCVIFFETGAYPYGLTSQGEWRFITSQDFKKEAFVPLSQEKPNLH